MTKPTVAFGSNTDPAFAKMAADFLADALGEPVEIKQLPPVEPEPLAVRTEFPGGGSAFTVLRKYPKVTD